MRVPIKWLYEFVPCDKSSKELAQLFTSKGVEVTNIIRVGEKLEGFIVAEVKNIDNNKLTVFDGKNSCQVTTVAYHLKPGDKIGYNPKTVQWLNPSLIEISEDILPYILNSEYKTGEPVLNYLDDYVLEFDILPNRADLMSIIGIARELASYEEIDTKFQSPPRERAKISIKYDIKEFFNLQVLNKEACPDYIARLICDVKIMPSPFWLQWRLIAVGLRPINNIVDATNYIMVKYGTPLHAFDYDKLLGKMIQVRFATKGEKIKTIDGTIQSVDDKVLLIADKKFPVAIAGIMGGIDTEINLSTKKVLLECARFDAKAIRRGSKRINLSTEASQRFEMGIDTEILETASFDVSNLIAELSNGEVANGKSEIRTEYKPVNIKISPDKVNRLLGINLEKERIKKILMKLNCEITDDKNIFITKIPAYRLDLKRDVDLIEEIGRIYGYDNLPSIFALRGNELGSADSFSQQLAKIRDFFIGSGFVETHSVSFCDEPTALKFTEENIVKLPNPLNERYTIMRPSILSTLLDVVKINYARDNKNLRMFEIGKTFENIKELNENTKLTAIICGQSVPIFWKNNTVEAIDYFDIKGIAESFLNYLKVSNVNFTDTPLKFLEQSNSVGIKYADSQFGYLGKIKKSILDRFDISVPVYTLELNLEILLKLTPSYRFYKSLPRFPSIVRDFAFIIDTKSSTIQMTQAIEKIAGALLESVEIFDYFKGKPLPADKCNLGIRITLRSEERTLQQVEVNKIFDRILTYLKDKMQVELRGETIQ
jgi:phenylalanyl-tRNA synthetase beta chain